MENAQWALGNSCPDYRHCRGRSGVGYTSIRCGDSAGVSRARYLRQPESFRWSFGVVTAICLRLPDCNLDDPPPPAISPDCAGFHLGGACGAHPAWNYPFAIENGFRGYIRVASSYRLFNAGYARISVQARELGQAIRWPGAG